MFTRVLVTIQAIPLLLFVALAHADDNADLIKQLQAQKALLDAQKDVIDSQSGILTSQKSLIDAQYPKFTGGKSGETAFGSSMDTFHANLFAYGALNSLATKLCAESHLKSASVVFVLSGDDLASVGVMRLVQDQLTELIDSYHKVIKEAPTTGHEKRMAALAPYAAAMALSSIADLTRLFRTDLKVSQETVNLSDADLANALSACGTDKFLLSASLATKPLLEAAHDDNSLWGQYKLATELRAQAQAAQLAADAEIATLDKTKPKNEAERKRYVELQTLSDRVKGLVTAQDKVETLFTGVNDSSKEPNLLRLLRGEALFKKINASPQASLLTATVVLKGGFSVVSQSIWRADKFYSRGGLAVSYRVLKADGSVVAAGVLNEESQPAEVHFR